MAKDEENGEQAPAKPILFPGWRYHKDGRSQVVNTPAEDAALKKESGWSDKPPEPAETEEATGAGETSGEQPAKKPAPTTTKR